MSEFIERSKHPGMTAEVEKHIMGGKGANAVDALPAKGKTLGTFTSKNDQGGVNYTLKADAGHFVRDVKGL
jgi:hypothetical protein